MRNLIARFASEPLGNFTNHSASVIVDYLISLRSSLAQLGSAARARHRRWSAKSRRNTGRQLERMKACSGRWLRLLRVQALRKYLAAPPVLPQRFSPHRTAAMPLPLHASLRQWPIRHPPASRSYRATPGGAVLHDKFVRAFEVRLFLWLSLLLSPRSRMVLRAQHLRSTRAHRRMRSPQLRALQNRGRRVFAQ